VPQDVIDATFAAYREIGTYGGRQPYEWHFDALKRQLDKREADYKD
jgi:hypothetical protein